jgi:GTP pyrophosphokinase
MTDIKNLVKSVKRYKPQANTKLIRKAYQFADAAHIDEKRLNGEPLIGHCLAVAGLLTELKMDEATIAAALLHDVIEHTNIGKEDLEGEFGAPVANLVDGVSVIKKVKTKTGDYYQVENLRKLLLATARDVRVVLIRLAEKLESLQTLEGLPESLRAETIQKSFDVYAPLAERIGVYHFKWQIEDEAFKHQNPEEHARIQKFLAETRREREEYIESIISLLRPKLAKEGIAAEIYGRPKHFYSIYKKMFVYRKSGETFREYLQRLHDVHGLRIMVDSINSCYRSLDIIHRVWSPLPDQIKDYIAHPKPNGYRSLHTAVNCLGGKIVEFQIRTHKMHEYNEFGPAAHVYYKEVGREKGSLTKAPVDRLKWLKSLVEWQKEIQDDREFEQALKIDVFGDRVFVLTPKGDVLDLPKGATPIDFAYKIHTELGNQCTGAKVDGKLMPLDYQLQNNEMVKILTSKQKKKPSTDWLEFVKTQEARSKIRKALRQR